jgi:hypothetical protein
MKKSTKAEPVLPREYLIVVHVDGYGGVPRWNSVGDVIVCEMPAHPSLIPGVALEAITASGVRSHGAFLTCTQSC